MVYYLQQEALLVLSLLISSKMTTELMTFNNCQYSLIALGTKALVKLLDWNVNEREIEKKKAKMTPPIENWIWKSDVDPFCEKHLLTARQHCIDLILSTWLDWRIFHFCLQDTYYTVHTLFDEFSHFTVLSSLMHLSMAFFRIYKKVLWLWLLTIKHKELCSTKLSKQKDREVLSVMYYI